MSYSKQAVQTEHFALIGAGCYVIQQRIDWVGHGWDYFTIKIVESHPNSLGVSFLQSLSPKDS